MGSVPSRLRPLLVLLVGGILALPLLPASAASVGTVGLSVLSGRADLVSGGSALVQVLLPQGADHFKVTVDGRDVTGAFGVGPENKLEGLVSGLQIGANILRATAGGAKGGQLA